MLLSSHSTHQRLLLMDMVGESSLQDILAAYKNPMPRALKEVFAEVSEKVQKLSPGQKGWHLGLIIH